MTALPDKVRGAYNHMRFTGEKLTDVDTVRFDFMRDRRSTYRYSSYTNPVPDTVPSEEAVKICREANDILADMVKNTPTASPPLPRSRWQIPQRQRRNWKNAA